MMATEETLAALKTLIAAGITVTVGNEITVDIDSSDLAKASQFAATLGQKARAASPSVALSNEDAAAVALLATEATLAALNAKVPAFGSAERSIVRAATLAKSTVVKASTGRIHSLLVRVAAASTLATYYVQLHDAASLPADGAAPFFSVRVDHTLNIPDLLMFGEDFFTCLGLPFATGCVAALSTTEDTLTIATVAADLIHTHAVIE